MALLLLDVGVERADGLQKRLVMLGPCRVAMGEPGVFVRGWRVGMSIAVIDRLLVARDLGVMGHDARLMGEDRGFGALKGGQRLHMVPAPAVMILRLRKVLGMGRLSCVVHFVFSLIRCLLPVRGSPPIRRPRILRAARVFRAEERSA